MNVSMNSSAALASSAGSATGASVAAGISVLKKALDIEAQNALQLINAISQSQQGSLPPNLGNNINTTA
ncbi:MAG: YjfB family protein [Sulfuricellaceae bacterium]|nr:YjfB family protein [Sulfuricellaceae bacterium]